MTFLIARPGTAPPAFTLPSPFTTAPSPLEGEVVLAETSIAAVLERCVALLGRMRQDAVAARAVAAAASSRLVAAAAALAAAQRSLDTARSVEAKARQQVQRAGQAGDQQRAHVARQRLATTVDTVRLAEAAARDRMADVAALERESADARQRAEFLAKQIAAAEQPIDFR